MQTLIIGGKRGLGKGLIDQFSELGEVVVTGKELDITNNNCQVILLDMMSIADIIINNAYAGSGQRDLLLTAFSRYSTSSKIFINIESVNAWREGELTPSQIIYATDKLALVSARRHLQKLPRNMSLIGVCPSTIDTEFNKNKNVSKMTISETAKIIFDCAKYAISGIEVSEIHIRKSNNV